MPGGPPTGPRGDVVDIGQPRRIIEVEPISLPLPDPAYPMPAPEPAEPSPAELPES